MSWDKIVKTTNSQLDKAKDFRYFAMLASFLFFLDFSLIIFYEKALTQVTFDFLTTGLNFGHILIFLCLFAFYLSFCVPLVQWLLRVIAYLIPFKILYFFHNDKWKDISHEDTFYTSELKEFAIKNNNSIAYNYHNELVEDSYRDSQLEHFCLAFLISILLNYYAYNDSKQALISNLMPFFKDSIEPFVTQLLAFCFYALIVLCFYFGVIRGGGFSLDLRGKYYFKNNGFRES
ncbi:hypothetical protein [Kangiella sp. HZ709]|uniref:hypothetical protein n=1 Tax=Kangiella sp. HZ709 TaxID=2666328 RepID=UPI0012AEE317|nr:hypothetical protein [Kangiella sp. HZ709]MRX27283.1 hypothetical protein [Kangiella sp. HZ709]